MTGRIFKAPVSPGEPAAKTAGKHVRRPGFRLIAVLVVMFALHSMQAFGQINTATLSGAVKDPSGAVVSNAAVIVLQTATGIARTAQTNEAGLFTVPLLQPGVYTVTVSKSGFESATESNIELQVNQLASLNITLTVGSVKQTVTVAASAPVLETETAGLGTVITTKEIDELPLNGRQFIQLLQLAPGSVPVSVSQTAVPNLGNSGSNVTPAVNGQTGRSNLFYVDGLYATDPFFGSLSMSPSVDAIQEFQEQTHTDQAQFGGSTGATVNLATKGGTNQFHGSAYEFFRNEDIEATPYFAATKGVFKQNQYGGTLGGPIIRNKLFFFGFYDGFRYTSAANNYSILPTSSELGGDFSALLPTTVIYDPATYDPTTQTSQPFSYGGKENVIDPTRLNQGILAMMKAYVPTPSGNAPAPYNNVNTAPGTTDNEQYSARVDWNIGTKDLLIVRWTVNEDTNTSPGALPTDYFAATFNGNNSGGTWVHTYSPTLVSQITAGYNSIDHGQNYNEPGAAAAFAAGGFAAGGFTDTPGGILVPHTPGLHPNGFFDLNAGWGPIGPERLGQISGSVNKQSGKHALNFGASYYWTSMYTNWSENDDYFNQTTTSNPCGAVVNSACTDTGGNSMASMLIGLPNSAGLQLGNAGVTLYDHIGALYAQDSWKIAPKLTVNFGIRWDYTSPVTEANNRLSGFDIHSGEWYIPKGDADAPTYPLPAGVIVSNTNTITKPDYKNFSPRVGFSYQALPKTVVSAGAGVTFDNWSGATQAAQNARGAWPSGYDASISDLNQAGITPGATAQTPFGALAPNIPTSPFPSGGGFLDTAFKNAYSWQWNLQVQRELGQNGALKLSYVGSQTSRSPIEVPFNISTVLGPTQVVPFPEMSNFTMIQSIGHMSYNAFEAQYTKRYSGGLSVNAGFTWAKNINVGCADYWEGCNIQDPYQMRTNRGIDDVDIPVIFTVSAVYELPFGKDKPFANSGVPSMLLGGWQINGIVGARAGQPFTPTINSDNANGGGGMEERPNVSGSTKGPRTLSEFFNTAAYSEPAKYTYGNAGRNSLLGPHYTDVDFSLFRSFRFLEHYDAQFRAEAFNLFNHPNFANPAATFGNPGFGTISSINGFPRELQLAATFRF
jgi:hypothetical protein